MWEAIVSNRRRSMVLISILGVLLILLGAVIGGVVERSVAVYRPVVRGFTVLHDEPPVPLTDQIWEARAGLGYGTAVAVGAWLLLWLVAVTAGDSILLGAAHAREIRKEDAPQLWNIVEEMTIASGLPKVPRIYVMDDPGLNAFAVGRKPEKAAVAVTSGLLKRLNRDELQGVIAHELGHIRNLDAQFLTLAGVMVGAIVLLSQGFLRGVFYSGGRRSSSRRDGGGAILVVAAVVLAVLAPLAAQLLYLACSRRREYLADASSARFTRYPEGLASALEKISQQAAGAADVNHVLAPMYIVNPLQGGSVFSLFSTHPPTQERIRILRGMAGASFAAYQEACQKVRGSDAQVVGQRTLEQDTAVAVRAPTPEPATPQQAVERAAAVGVLLDRVGGFVVIPCVCGARLKLPPTFTRDAITCPRCGRQHAVPQAEPAVAGVAAAPARPMRYQRRGRGWESFKCGCGHPIQLSPQFSATQATCPKCGGLIEITS